MVYKKKKKRNLRSFLGEYYQYEWKYHTKEAAENIHI